MMAIIKLWTKRGYIGNLISSGEALQTQRSKVTTKDEMELKLTKNRSWLAFTAPG